MAFVDPESSSPRSVLRESDVPADPISLFRTWWEQAQAAKLLLPEAMTLATATPSGAPSARLVLLRGVDDRGFVFFTNYDSRKGRELAENPRAALVLYWAELEQQVRIEGKVERVTAAESDAYFQTRPRGSQLGAWVSPQSEVIGGREFLEGRMKELIAQHAGGPVPRPPHWGGYRVLPVMVEFLQGQENRLHDRLRYQRLQNGGWILERLAP